MFNDRYDCAHCGFETKRIYHVLELPSCCAMCDKALDEEYFEKETTDVTTNE